MRKITKAFYILFHPSTRSFSKVAERDEVGTYMHSYADYKRLQWKARAMFGASVFFVVATSLAFSIYFPFIWHGEPRGAYALTTISSAVEYTSNTTTNDNVVIASGGTVTLTGGITWTINGTLTVQSGGSVVFRETGGTYVTYPTLSVSGAITVDSGGTVHSNSKGFTGGAVFTDGTGTGKGTAGSNSVGGGGAGHGGAGGNGYGASNAGVKYGSTLAPVTAGSGGAGGGATGAAVGGAGGGVIRIDSGGTLTVNGTVSANGANAGDAGSTGGGGAGGSIYVTAAGLDGTGSLAATGGRGGNNTGAYQAGGGGGGGRIATHFNTPGASIATLKTNSSVVGGVGGDGPTTLDGKVGQVGTLFFLDVDNKDIDIYNGPDFFQEGDTITLSGTQTTFTGTPKFGDSDATTNDNDAVFDNANSTTQFDDITIAADAYVESKIASGNTIFNLSVTYTGILTINSPTSTDGSCRSFTATTAQDASFDTCFVVEQATLTGPTLTINTNGQLNADGYGNTGGAANANGNGTGGGVYGANVSGGGGGHGGAGGNGSGSGATGGSAHGSNTAPVTAGSGGGGGSASSGAIGGNGGGIIRVTLSSGATVNGTITADGTNGPDVNGRTGGGGSGGSIYISVPGTLAGSGSFTATGGRGGNTASYPAGGGGGGGRIAYYYAALTYSGSATITAGIGGDGTGASDGVAGTNGTTYTYQYAVPSQPSITAPTNGTNNASLTPTITSGAFSGDLTHTSSDWQVDDNSDFSSVTFSSATDTTNLTSIAVSPALSPNTTYYARMRHNSAAGNSTWATSVSFTTVANAPSAPTLAASSATTLGVTVNVNSNPASTEFAIQETGSSNYVQANGTLGVSAVWQNNATWGTVSVTGLSVGTQYTLQVKARNSASVETSFSSTSALYTLANVPGTPTVNNPASATVDIALSTNSNPASTEFAIQETGSSNYVQANGTLSASAVWQTNANWGIKTISGLSVATQYTFKVKARNGNNTETSFSSTSALYTLANAPGTPTVNTPTVSSLTAILSENSNPSSVTYAVQETSTSKYVQADGTLGTSAAWQTYTNWGSASGIAVSGLSANTQYTFKLKARNGDSTETAFGTTASTTTLVNAPSTPTVDGGTASSLNVTVNTNSNPATVTYAILETSLNKYVLADGTLGTSAVWQTSTVWGTITVTGLSGGTEYTFKVKAKNSDGVETAYSATASAATNSGVSNDPSIANASDTELTVIIDVADRPSTTTYALKVVVDNTTYYIQEDGSLGTSTVYRSYTDWGRTSGVEVSNLSPNTTYSVQVYSKDALGNITTLGSSVSSTTKASIPGTLTTASVTNSSLQLTLPENNNPETTEYLVQVSSHDSYIGTDGTMTTEEVWQTRSAINALTIRSLDPNTLYIFQVKARNSAGVETDFSSITTLFTLAASINQPLIAKIEKTDTGDLIIQTVLRKEGNPDTTEYALRVEDTAADNTYYLQEDHSLGPVTDWQLFDEWIEGDSIVTVKGLSSKNRYAITVIARNGDSVESEGTPTTFEFAIFQRPKKPQNISVKQQSGTAVKIIWDAVNQATTYRLQLRVANEFNKYYWKRLRDILAPNVKIKKLYPLKKYQIRIRACNAIGCSRFTKWKGFHSSIPL